MQRVRRPIRTAIAVLMIALAAGAVAAPAAQAAPARVRLQLTDPLSTDPVRLQVAAADADGNAAAFTGTVTLTVGRTKASVPVRSAEGEEEVEVPTTRLTAGTATASAVLRVGGRRSTAVVPGFIDIPSALVLRGFGCGVISPAQQRIAWQVVSMNGQPYQWPAWRPDGSSFPTYVHTAKPTRIADSLGQPIRTTGSVVVLQGSRVVGRVGLRSADRRLLFSVPWPGRRFPGAYTAVLTLTDALGRTTSATQQLVVATSTAGLCA